MPPLSAMVLGPTGSRTSGLENISSPRVALGWISVEDFSSNEVFAVSRGKGGADYSALVKRSLLDLLHLRFLE